MSPSAVGPPAVRPQVIQVVIPAHNEAELLRPCLDSVARAVDRLHERTAAVATVTVVADSCTDGTLEVVEAFDATALPVSVRCVGAARDAGVRQVLAGVPERPPGVWVAMTDADSTVPPHWLEAQLAMATSGLGLWVGSVHPDPTSISVSVLGEWWARHRRPDELHIHGANLGFTADTYRRAGGFPPLAEHEDVAFVRAALAAGVAWATGAPAVHTSGRTDGRTPGGFAQYLRLLVAEVGEH
jgi:glycosyltransferase involved in cell wall biosynthesis